MSGPSPDPPSPGPRKLISVKSVCEQTGLGKSVVYDLIARRELKSYKVGRRVLIDQADLDRFLDDRIQQ